MDPAYLESTMGTGTFRFGTLHGYRTPETAPGLQDAGEGWLDLQYAAPNSVGPKRLILDNVIARRTVLRDANLLCLSLSSSRCLARRWGHRTCVRITDAFAFKALVTAALHCKELVSNPEHVYWRRVWYGDRTHRRPVASVHELIERKEAGDACEREYRIYIPSPAALQQAFLLSVPAAVGLLRHEFTMDESEMAPCDPACATCHRRTAPEDRPLPRKS